MSHAILVGSTNPIMYFRAFNTDGTAKVDLLAAEAGLSLSVYRTGGSSVSIASLSDKAADDTAHADGAIRQVGSGNLYTVDAPDAAVASQFGSAAINGSYTAGVIEGVPHPLVGYDGTDAVRIGMTALPNTASAGDNMYALLVTGISTAVETAAGKHSVAATVMMSTNAALSGSTLTAMHPSDDTTFNTYTVTVDASASNITGMS